MTIDEEYRRQMTIEEEYRMRLDGIMNDIAISKSFMLTEGISPWRNQPIKFIHYDCYPGGVSHHYFLEYYMPFREETEGVRVPERIFLGWVHGTGVGGVLELARKDIEPVLTLIEDKMGRMVRI